MFVGSLNGSSFVFIVIFRKETHMGIKGLTSKAGLFLRKHSPEILGAVGMVATVAGVIWACKSTVDSADDILVRRSLERPAYKEKLRMRAYGTVHGNDTVFMEIKKKYNGVVYKRRVPVSLRNISSPLSEVTRFRATISVVDSRVRMVF